MQMMFVCFMLLDMGPTLNYGYYSQEKPIVKFIFTLHAITGIFLFVVGAHVNFTIIALGPCMTQNFA